MQKKFLSIKKASEISSLSKRFIYQLCQNRKLRYYRIGRRILVDSEDLEEFIIQDPIEPVEDWSEKLRLK